MFTPGHSGSFRTLHHISWLLCHVLWGRIFPTYLGVKCCTCISGFCKLKLSKFSLTHDTNYVKIWWDCVWEFLNNEWQVFDDEIGHVSVRDWDTIMNIKLINSSRWSACCFFQSLMTLRMRSLSIDFFNYQLASMITHSQQWLPILLIKKHTCCAGLIFLFILQTQNIAIFMRSLWEILIWNSLCERILQVLTLIHQRSQQASYIM